MADEFTETTEESWGSRLKGSLSSVVAGFCVVILCIGGLIYNESDLVKARKALWEAEKNTKSVASIDSINPNLEGNIVYLTGLAEANTPAEDKTFGVSVTDTLKIQRSVELYQWVEHTSSKKKKKVGGGTQTETTYSYDKQWASFLYESEDFKYPTGHKNPVSFPFDSSVSLASDISLGAFTLTEDVVSLINNYTPLPLPPSIEDIPAEIKQGKTITNYKQNGLYIGTGTQEVPVVGDVRISFTSVPSQTISVVAKQVGKTLVDYAASNGREVLLVEKGKKSKDQMFDDANKDQTQLAWIVRLVCFLLMWVALTMIAEPLSTFADVLPFLGDCVGCMVALVSAVVAFCISLVTIALAWLFFRPVFSLCIFGFVGVVMFALHKFRGGKKAAGEEEIALAGSAEAAKGSYTDAVVV